MKESLRLYIRNRNTGHKKLHASSTLSSTTFCTKEKLLIKRPQISRKSGIRKGTYIFITPYFVLQSELLLLEGNRSSKKSHLALRCFFSDAFLVSFWILSSLTRCSNKSSM
ncbi:uncharacterized protein [Coffea arabica]|uniref:Uncharacterized protein n=1 Tax=Coffea arabica TaxID=13443 RepID=A0ABM4UTD8_COFAR